MKDKNKVTTVRLSHELKVRLKYHAELINTAQSKLVRDAIIEKLDALDAERKENVTQNVLQA